MKYVHLPIALLSLTALASAQAFTSPPGYLSKEGVAMASGWASVGGYSVLLGQRAAARYQFVDGESRGKVRVVNSIGYRLDYRNHTTSQGSPGRTWSLVTLKMSETDITKMNRIFSQNPTTTQTMVFRGSVTWPTQLGTPGPTAPAPWDKRLAFPFSTPWRYSGMQDILQDYTFRGGVLTNNASWGASQKFYFLDGLFYVTNIFSGYRSFPRTPTCMDPAAKRTPPYFVSADSMIQYSEFSKAYTPVPAWAGNVVIQGWTDRTAPNAPVIQAIGIAALKNGTGVPFPGSCTNLILDFSKGAVLLFKFANVNGQSPPTATIAAPVSVANTISGLQVWSQAAWIHSQTKFFTLSRATLTTRSGLGMNNTVPKRKVSFSSDTTSTSGLVPFMDATIIRYN